MGILVAGFIGTVLGFISAKTFFVHSWTALIPWALVGLAAGFSAKTKRGVVWSGATYGFLLPIVFTIAGYEGIEPARPIFYGFSLILGVVGAGCGIVLSLIGRKLQGLRKPKSTN